MSTATHIPKESPERAAAPKIVVRVKNTSRAGILYNNGGVLLPPGAEIDLTIDERGYKRLLAQYNRGKIDFVNLPGGVGKPERVPPKPGAADAPFKGLAKDLERIRTDGGADVLEGVAPKTITPEDESGDDRDE